MPATTFHALDDATPLNPVEGIEIRGVFGVAGSLSLVDLAPDAVLPHHSHPHEQLGMVLEGTLILITGGREHEVGPRQAYVIPGGVEHGARGGPEGCVVVDFFIPARDDYRASAAPEKRR